MWWSRSAVSLVARRTQRPENGSQDACNATATRTDCPQGDRQELDLPVVTTVGSLVSIGAVSRAECVASTYLGLTYVQVGGTVYDNVVITVRPCSGQEAECRPARPGCYTILPADC